jgi:hypothetical protein
LSVLRDFINRFNFVRMKPHSSFIKSGLPEKTDAYSLVEPGKQYATYFFSGTNAAPKHLALTLNLPKGAYRVEWIDVLSGNAIKAERVKSADEVTLISPEWRGEIALRINR